MASSITDVSYVPSSNRPDFGSAWARFKRNFVYSRTVSALSHLSDRELNDIGIPRNEIRATARRVAGIEK